MKTKILIIASILAVGGSLTSCNDYLDKEPLTSIPPEKYFNTEADLLTYCDGRYTDVLPSHGNWSYGIYGNDDQTDMMTKRWVDNKYQDGKWLTDLNNDDYKNLWSRVNAINFFFDNVLPKYEAGAISGSSENIRHYIGEMYFLRAYEYFKALKKFGDLPIVTTCLPDQLETLTDASKRSPRNKVARFILEDCQTAYNLMDGNDKARTRINAATAMLLKSRVALYEGTFEKNFAGTAFVPGTSEWPGKNKDYNAGFTFESGSAENEWKYFLQVAVQASDKVAELTMGTLAQNTGVVPQEEGKAVADYENENPWLAMFGTTNIGSFNEVLLWREYNNGLGLNHNVVVQAQKGNQSAGTTRACVDGFIMANGLPIYASGSGYQGDNTIHNVRIGRDPRLFVMLKEPGQKNVLIPGNGSHANPVEGIPALTESGEESGYSTGYALRKGNNPDQTQCGNGQNYTACPLFRSVEALLNYIEAYYELNGSLGGNCDRYWRAIRARHTGLETDYNITINATDMSREAMSGDWGAYTAGTVIDATRFNIRRERRCELMAEGYRWDDLVRWRSLDQMCTKGFKVEGCHIWNQNDEMIKYFATFGSGDDADPEKLKTKIAASISSPGESEYVLPHRAGGSQLVPDGLKWHMAHYLSPLPIKQLMLTSPDGSTVSGSPLYQNPYWPSESGKSAEK